MELLVSVAIAAIGLKAFVAGMTTMSAEKAKIRYSTALEPIEAEIVRIAKGSGEKLFLGMSKGNCRSPSTPQTWNGCEAGSTATQCILSSGISLGLLNEANLDKLSNAFPQIAQDATYTEGLRRCKETRTFYRNKVDALSDFTNEKGLYFCSWISAASQSDAKLPAMARMQPVIAEFVYVPFDAASGTQLTCSSIKTTGGLPSTGIGILYYSIYWSSDTSFNGKPLSKKVTGFTIS